MNRSGSAALIGLSWARRCRIPSFVKLARQIVNNRPEIEATLDHGLSNESVSYCASC